MYQKTEWYFFDSGLINGKSKVKVEKFHIFKLSLTLPQGDTFTLWTHFSHLWIIDPKSIIQIFDTLWINKFH